MAEQNQTQKGSKRFFKDTLSELKKVIWPTGKQVVKGTTVVIVIIAIVTIILYVFDLSLGAILSYILGK